MKLLLPVFTIAMTACAYTVELTDQEEEILNTDVICKSAQECKIMWDRANYFVNTHSAYKIRIANDNLIETHTAIDHSPELSFSVIKQPLDGGHYKIIPSAYCNFAFACKPDHTKATIRAKQYIKTGIE